MRGEYIFWQLNSQCVNFLLTMQATSLEPCEDTVSICFNYIVENPASHKYVVRNGSRVECSRSFNPGFGYVSPFVLNTYKYFLSHNFFSNSFFLQRL